MIEFCLTYDRDHNYNTFHLLLGVRPLLKVDLDRYCHVPCPLPLIHELYNISCHHTWNLLDYGLQNFYNFNLQEYFNYYSSTVFDSCICSISSNFCSSIFRSCSSTWSSPSRFNGLGTVFREDHLDFPVAYLENYKRIAK